MPPCTGQSTQGDPFAAAAAGLTQARVAYAATTQQAAQLSGQVLTLQGQLQLAQQQIAQLQAQAGPFGPLPVDWYPSPAPPASDDQIHGDSTAGDDIHGTGSTTQPFRSAGRCYHQAQVDLSDGVVKHPAILLKPSTQPYQPLGWINGPLEVGRYGNSTPEERPVFAVMDVGIGGINLQNVYVHDCEFVGWGAMPANYALYVNGGNHVWFSDNVVRNFIVGVSAIGNEGMLDLQTVNNAFMDGWNPLTLTASTMMCSAIYTEATAPVRHHNFIYHWGYLDSWDMSNATIFGAIMFCHGEYINPGTGHATPGPCHHEFTMSCASNGIQGRTRDQIIDSCVFICNGRDVDAFIATGENLDGSTAVESAVAFNNCLVFGSQRNKSPDLVGGLELGSNGSVSGCKFFGSSPLQTGPAIHVTWMAQDTTPASAMPADVSGTISNCNGIWMGPGIQVDPNRTASTSIINSAFRAPKPGEHVPNIYDYFPAKTDRDVAEAIAEHRHDRRYSTDAVLEWGMKLPTNP